MKDLSVIIPVYNAGLLIDRCLDSIFTQKGEYQVEVICIDDGSTDNSVEIIQQRKEPTIRLLSQPNCGPACARNKGIAAAEGRYIAFLDADDYWEQDFIEKTLDFLQTHAECIAVSVGQKHITMSGESIKPDCIANYDKPIVIDDFHSFWTQYNHICTGSIAIRTEMARATGGQRKELRICEDMEFWVLLSTYGKMGFIPEVLFVSDGNRISKHYGFKKYALRFRNIQTFDSWQRRIAARMSEDDLKRIKPRLNDIVIGTSRSLILAGEYKRARWNLRYYTPAGQPHYIVKINSHGPIAWYSFSILYRSYKYVKMNLPYYYHKVFKWKE